MDYFEFQPLAASLLVHDERSAVLVDGVVGEVHEHVGSVVAIWLVVQARGEPGGTWEASLGVCYSVSEYRVSR